MEPLPWGVRGGRATRSDYTAYAFFFIPTLDRIERNDSTIDWPSIFFMRRCCDHFRDWISRRNEDDVGTTANRLGDFSKLVASPPALWLSQLGCLWYEIRNLGAMFARRSVDRSEWRTNSRWIDIFFFSRSIIMIENSARNKWIEKRHAMAIYL